MAYEHTQTGPLAWFIAIFFLSLIVLSTTLEGGDTSAALVMGAVMIPVLALVFAFSRLTVRVNATHVRVAFGFGWPKRTFQLSDLAHIRQVRNRWWYGLGIRVAPNGAWVFNVWGLDAVELETDAGKKFRVGTDDVEGLIAALSLATSLPPETG